MKKDFADSRVLLQLAREAEFFETNHLRSVSCPSAHLERMKMVRRLFPRCHAERSEASASGWTEQADSSAAPQNDRGLTRQLIAYFRRSTRRARRSKKRFLNSSLRNTMRENLRSSRKFCWFETIRIRTSLSPRREGVKFGEFVLIVFAALRENFDFWLRVLPR